MKICLININNCINYSQYGPFLYENIKKGDLIVYNTVSDTAQLNDVFEKMVAEYNRNAFSSKEVKLVFLIPRNMDNPTVKEYEFYQHINIYMHIMSKLRFVSTVAEVFVDTYSEKAEGKAYEEDKNISSRYYCENIEFENYLPMVREVCKDKKELSEKIIKIKDPTFRSFFESILAEMDEDYSGVYKESIDAYMNVFSGKCSAKLNVDKIVKIYEKIEKFNVSGSILKMLKLVYYIKALASDAVELENTYDSFKIDYDDARKVVATYKARLEKWLATASNNKEYPAVDTIKVFSKLNNVKNFEGQVDNIVKNQLTELDDKKKKSVDVVNIVFEKLGEIVRDANDEMHRFVNKDITEYFKDENYEYINAGKLNDDDFDEIKHENELLKKINELKDGKLPGYVEELKLEQRLEDANKKIEELLRCKREYSFKAFFKTLLFAGLGVLLLYFLAQYSVFFAENSLYIYLIYSAVILLTFFNTYLTKSVDANKKITKLMKKCKLEVSKFLNAYKELAKNFEENLNAQADYYCYKEYLERKKAVEALRQADAEKLNWHKRKVREVLNNINHFNDLIQGTTPALEGDAADFNTYDHDAEHTAFYQMRIF